MAMLMHTYDVGLTPLLTTCGRYADETLHVSLNGQQYAPTSDGSSLLFRYHAAPRPTVLVPPCGPAAGGALLSVYSENLAAAEISGFECDFRGDEGDVANGTLPATSNATLLSLANGTAVEDIGAGVAVCVTPAAPAGTEAFVGMSVLRDSQRYSTHGDEASVSLPYVFYPSLPPTAAYAPHAGPLAGGTILHIGFAPVPASVRATHAARAVLADAACRFGPFTPGMSPSETSLLAPASLATADEAVLCAAPNFPYEGSVQLHLALNGRDYEPASHNGTATHLPFSFYLPPVLKRVVPAGAPAGTKVVLLGDRLLGGGLAGVAHTCSFGGRLVPATPHLQPVLVANTWRRDTVSCLVPPRGEGEGLVRLSLSLNGQQYTAEDVRFVLEDEIQ